MLIAFMVVPFLAGSQSGLVRIELDAALNSDIYQVVPCNETGLLVFYETREMVDETNKNWYFTFYGQELEPAWNANIPVLDGTDYKDYVLQDTLLYLFFINTGKSKPGSENFQFIRMDLKNGISSAIKGILPSETNFRELLMMDEKAYIALNLKDDQAAVFLVNLESPEVSALNIQYPDQNFIEDICLDTNHMQLLILVSNYLDRKQNGLYLQAMDLTGQFVYDVEIQELLAGKYLNTGRIYPLPDSSIVILGAYGGLASRIPSGNEYFGVESSGVFSTSVLNRKQQYMNYYNFMEFSNLRAGVSARDFYRLQKKKVRETPEYSLNYELLVHDPQVRDSLMVILMEAFYPEFRTVSDISYDYYGRPVTQTYTVFDGYRIFNTILAAFDKEGALKWDNSLEMNMAPTNNLIKRASSFFDGEPSLLFYNDGYRLSYRVYLENTELEGFTKMDLETSHSGDRITAIGYNTIAHWYGYNFIAYGYHTIQNNLLSDRNERTVFYINKVALE